MKISLSWLKYYVDIQVSVDELCDRMVMAGFEVESVEDLSESMEKVVVGQDRQARKASRRRQASNLPDRHRRSGTDSDRHRRGQRF